ncbi:LysR family transcriptional regulator (plasmid) [Nitratireductor rhodophyticola]|uniref:LysR family transcriptional regulator n=1 Tax=Nitratireductor rhodophyticola TaxID=2854036 RepID=UPI00081417E3|nr:LysR family transcriptional regulator [Nitratireductor rhodophyticola]WPZ16571.1 LysR family transcriptional regulator [Nitratireductor rhodophyticola]
METRDLQTFLAVAETGSITKAAVLLERSQPSVTRTIQELEAKLGFSLLQRAGRRVMLSDEGIAFEEEARRVLNSLTGLAARARAIATGRGRTLQVAATSAIATGVIPAALSQFAVEKLPPEIQIAQYLPNRVAQEVGSGGAELGFSSMPLDVPGLEVVRLYCANDVAALPEGDPLAEHDVVPLSAFAGRRFVTMLDPGRFQRQVSQTMEARGVTPGPLIRTNVSYSALRLVQKTGVVSIIDPVSAYGVQLPGVVIRPIDVAVPFYWGAVTASSRPLRPLVTQMIEAVEAEALRLIPDLQILDPARSAQTIDRHASDSPVPHRGSE